jgi:hypothetical protein
LGTGGYSVQAWHELQIPRQAEKEMLTLLFEVPGTVTVELAVESVSSGIPVATRVTIEPCTEDCLGLMLQPSEKYQNCPLQRDVYPSLSTGCDQ